MVGWCLRSFGSFPGWGPGKLPTNPGVERDILFSSASTTNGFQSQVLNLCGVHAVALFFSLSRSLSAIHRSIPLVYQRFTVPLVVLENGQSTLLLQPLRRVKRILAATFLSASEPWGIGRENVLVTRKGKNDAVSSSHGLPQIAHEPFL